jgi:hypothetical protein
MSEERDKVVGKVEGAVEDFKDNIIYVEISKENDGSFRSAEEAIQDLEKQGLTVIRTSPRGPAWTGGVCSIVSVDDSPIVAIDEDMVEVKLGKVNRSET